MVASSAARQPPGQPVDSYGGPTVDPSENVKALNEASIKRIDDLAAMREKWDGDRFRFLETQVELRDKRQDDLRLAQDEIRRMQAAHFREITLIHADYESKLRVAESDRINAIRAVDVAAVQRAAEVSNVQATTLAAQVQTSAEALRNQQTAYAAQVDAKLAQVLDPVQADIRDLRKTQSEQIGAKEKTTEGSRTNQWAVALVIGVIISVVEITLHFIPVAPIAAAP